MLTIGVKIIAAYGIVNTKIVSYIGMEDSSKSVVSKLPLVILNYTTAFNSKSLFKKMLGINSKNVKELQELP